ncbi:DUF1330 domain-containing protein [Novosphingobium sp. BL-52-GroH]|uniref:DUF1330 domain-containing protein n=1 Tax=Novosphingobium sp. BL-52-GroH TaxID=3349877 RepID=UPI00384A7AD4
MGDEKPVIMVVTAAITDSEAYASYMKALVGSGLFARYGGVPLATGAVSDTLEGDYRPGEITALVEFASREAAQAFWDCAEYREIARLRKTAGAFRVGLWRKFKAPAEAA